MQIQCPGCKTKLQLPDETKPGTRVQCPACKKVLALPGAPTNPPPAGAPKKQPAPPPKPTPAPAPAPAPSSLEDDDEAGLYGVRKDPDLDDEEEEEEAPAKGKSKGPAKPPKKKKPNINYAPDTSIKDLRGPAMTHVVQPSNYMMLQCGLVMVTAIASIAMSVWPFMFQERVLTPAVALKPYYADKMAAGGQEGKLAKSRWDRIDGNWVEWPREKKAKEDDTGFSRGEPMKDFEYEAAMVEVNKHYPFAVAWLVLSMLILAYALTVAFGAVKMQSLESYAWSMTSAILAMLPFGAIGLLVYFFKPSMDFQNDMPIILFVLAVEAIFTLLVGLMNLAVLLKQEVKAGFAYRSDAVG